MDALDFEVRTDNSSSLRVLGHPRRADGMMETGCGVPQTRLEGRIVVRVGADVSWANNKSSIFGTTVEAFSEANTLLHGFNIEGVAEERRVDERSVEGVVGSELDSSTYADDDMSINT